MIKKILYRRLECKPNIKWLLGRREDVWSEHEEISMRET